MTDVALLVNEDHEIRRGNLWAGLRAHPLTKLEYSELAVDG